MKKYFNRRSKGLTLMEVLIYVAIAGIITVTLFSIVMSLIQLQGKISLERNVWENGQRSMDRIFREIQKSTEVIEADSVFGSHPGTLKIKTLDYDTDNEVEKTILIKNDRLVFEITGGDEVLTSEDITVSNLTFTNVKNGSNILVFIDLTMTKTKKILGQDYQATTTLRSSVAIRNQ